MQPTDRERETSELYFTRVETPTQASRTAHGLGRPHQSFPRAAGLPRVTDQREPSAQGALSSTQPSGPSRTPHHLSQLRVPHSISGLL